MRTKHRTLLAGVATLALTLIGGGGIAAAQQAPQGQGGASASMNGQSSTQAKQGGANTSMKEHAQTGSQSGGGSMQKAEGSKSKESPMAQKRSETGKTENRSAEETNGRTGGQTANRSAKSSQGQFGENAKNKTETKQRFGENANGKGKKAHERFGQTEKNRHERFGQTEKNRQERFGTNERSERNNAQNEQERRGGMSAQRNERNGEMKGLQGNASVPMQGSHVNLTSEQRTQIRNTVIDARGAPRVGHVDFDVNVGTVVPRDRVHVVRVPETLVRIHPQWRGYDYFIVEDQVVIVDPHDMRIVAVLDV